MTVSIKDQKKYLIEIAEEKVAKKQIIPKTNPKHLRFQFVRVQLQTENIISRN